VPRLFACLRERRRPVTDRAAVYVRRSQDQPGVAEQAKAVQRQEDAGREFIERRGWTLHGVYRDEDTSGYLFEGRAGLQRMLRAAEAGEFQHLVLFDLDRLGRNSRRTNDTLHKLADLGVQVWDYSTGRAVDLDSFEGRITTTLQAEFAQQYRDTIRKKTAHAMLAKAKRGEPTGRAALGYKNVKTKDGRKDWARDERTASLVIEIHEMYASGLHFAGIARRLNQRGEPTPTDRSGAWSSVIIRNMVRRPEYRGIVVAQKWKTLYGRELGRPGKEWDAVRRPSSEHVTMPRPDLRIISPELEARVKARLDEADALIETGRYYGSRGRSTRPRYLLSGLLICPGCGFPFDGRTGAKRERGIRYDVYLCSSRRRRQGICSVDLMLPITETDATIVEALEREAMGGRVIDELLSRYAAVSEASSAGARIEAEKQAVQADIDTLLQAIAKKHITSEVAGKKIAGLQAKLVELNRLARPKTPQANALRQALQTRASKFLDMLRSEPLVARSLIQRLLGPISFGWSDAVDEPVFFPLDDSKPADGLSRGELALIEWSAPLQLSAFGEGLLEPSLLETIGAS
jgi:site-specific DNA recombinase